MTLTYLRQLLLLNERLALTAAWKGGEEYLRCSFCSECKAQEFKRVLELMWFVYLEIDVFILKGKQVPLAISHFENRDLAEKRSAMFIQISVPIVKQIFGS